MGRISISNKVVYLIETTSIKHDDVHKKEVDFLMKFTGIMLKRKWLEI